MVSMFSTAIKKSQDKTEMWDVGVNSNFLDQSELTNKMYVPHPHSTSTNFLAYFNIVLTHVFKQNKITKFLDTVKPSWTKPCTVVTCWLWVNSSAVGLLLALWQVVGEERGEQMGKNADHSPSFSGTAKSGWSYTSILSSVFTACTGTIISKEDAWMQTTFSEMCIFYTIHFIHDCSLYTMIL